MAACTGRMGSSVIRLQFHWQEIPDLAKADWNRSAPRVFLDPDTGFVELMSPSLDHEIHARGADTVAHEIARACGLRLVALGRTRWRRTHDPKDSGWEADCCFYVGGDADGWANRADKGPEAGIAFADCHPPTLVVDVERVWGDGDRPDVWRMVGAREMWRLDRPGGRDAPLVAEILDLQNPDGPETPLAASAVLPLCTPEFIAQAARRAVGADREGLAAMIAEAQAPETAPP